MIFPSNSVLADSKMSSIPDMSGDNTELSIEEAVQDEHGEFSEEEKKMHEGFMREAIKMAELALSTDETPVACVFVHNGKIIGRGMNATNRTLNGTRHAEFQAIAEILSPPPVEANYPPISAASSAAAEPLRAYPASILKESDLYVTVEPCIMCASLLRQYGIRKVYFGAINERFGGTGGVFNIHQGPGPEKGYEVSGGWLREEAIMLLRRFYVQENEKAPEPRNKKERKLKTEIEPMVKPAAGAGASSKS